MGDVVRITVDGAPLDVPAQSTLAAALLSAREPGCRRSVTGAVRGPLCGMGSCFECRVTIDGVPHRRACLEPVVPGMVVATGD